MSNIIRLLPKVKKKKIGVIIQARMTSKRFPGKSMALLDNKPVLQHVIERAKEIKGEKGAQPEAIIIAVPDMDESELMLELADKLEVENFCGDENNVLDRYYNAAKFFNLDVVIRITADCPYINPRISSEVLQLLLWRKLDYCSNVFPKRTYPRGFDTECFTFDCLEAAYKLAETDEEKEHVTTWMQQNAHELKTACVVQKLNKSHINLCIDEPTDIERLETMLKPMKVVVSV